MKLAITAMEVSLLHAATLFFVVTARRTVTVITLRDLAVSQRSAASVESLHRAGRPFFASRPSEHLDSTMGCR
jgi:hypothetical protein